MAEGNFNFIHYDPIYGYVLHYSMTIDEFRDRQVKDSVVDMRTKQWKYNPYTGWVRSTSAITDDPLGITIINNNRTI